MFSQILKDLITLHKLDSAGNVKSKTENRKSTNETATKTTTFGLKKSDVQSDLNKEFRTTFNKSNQSSNVKYNNNDGNKSSFGLKNKTVQNKSQVKIQEANNKNNLDSKSSVNFYTDSSKLMSSKSNEIQSILNNKSSNQIANEFKATRDRSSSRPEFKHSFAVANEENECAFMSNLPSKNQNNSDASLRTRKQDALIDLAILLKKSQSKINLNGKLEDSQKLFEIQATLANEFKAAMLERKNEEQFYQQQQQQQQQQTQFCKSKDMYTCPKYDALSKLTDDFRKNFTEIKKNYLNNKDSQLVNCNNIESALDFHFNNNNNNNRQSSRSRPTALDMHNILSNEFKNSTAQINKSLKNLESKSSVAAFNSNSKSALRSDIQQNSNIINEFKQSSSTQQRKTNNLASKSTANFYSSPKSVKSGSTQTDIKGLGHEQPASTRRTLASKSTANLYEPASSILKSSLVNEFKSTNGNTLNRRLASKSSANLYSVDANTGSNMFKSDTQPNLAHEFKSMPFSLNKNAYTKSSQNISSTMNNNTNSPSLKNIFVQSNEFGDTYIVQRPEGQQAMTLTNEYKSASDLNSNNNKLKSSMKNKSNSELNSRKSKLEQQSKILNEFKLLSSKTSSKKSSLESKSQSKFLFSASASSIESPAASLPQPPPSMGSQLIADRIQYSPTTNKLDIQTSLAREFKKSLTNLNQIRSSENTNKSAGVSSIYLSSSSRSPNSLQQSSDSPTNTDSSIDYEINSVMMMNNNNKLPNIHHHQHYNQQQQYIQSPQQQPILVGNFNAAKSVVNDSQELLIELERTGISSSTPIEAINETRDSDLHNLNASELQKWLWTNEQEANNSLSPIPLNEYPINHDPNPIIIKKKPDQKIELKKEFFVRYLQPPRPLEPGKLIIEQEVSFW